MQYNLLKVIINQFVGMLITTFIQKTGADWGTAICVIIVDVELAEICTLTVCKVHGMQDMPCKTCQHYGV